MQLSIEAIIILVIAFTLLGFGVYFVKSFFTQAQEQATSKISQAGSSCDASAENPIYPKEFDVKYGGSTKKDLCVLNKGDAALSASFFIKECIDQNGNPVKTAPGTDQVAKIISVPQDLKRGDSKTYSVNVVVNTESTTRDLPDTFICNVVVCKLKSDKTACDPGTSTAPQPQIGPIQMTFKVS